MEWSQIAAWLAEHEWLRMILLTLARIIVAAALGGFIGYEREQSHRPAGFRTHILVAVGSALVMLTSVYIFEAYEGRTNMDPARLGAQVISGIGFLGAGTILREGFSIKGLTTAASLWAVSCIGLAVGMGYYAGALIATLVIYITLNFLKKFMEKGHTLKNLFIEVAELDETSTDIGVLMKKMKIDPDSVEIVYPGDSSMFGKKTMSTVLKIKLTNISDPEFKIFSEAVRAMQGVQDLYVN